MFVCFKGRNDLCLTNRIRICRVPRGTNETQWYVSLSPKPRTPSTPRWVYWKPRPKDKLRKSRKVLLSTRCAMLRFREITNQNVKLEGPTASYPQKIIVAAETNEEIWYLFSEQFSIVSHQESKRCQRITNPKSYG